MWKINNAHVTGTILSSEINLCGHVCILILSITQRESCREDRRNISAVTIELVGNLRYRFFFTRARETIAFALDGPQANRLERANQTATEEAKGKVERDDGRKQCHGR